ncbi:MAG: hypothetical protein ACKVJC_10100 [Flavobacteriales bacterium]|tara:strand:- start:428 stop:811 length:384 start_codon:yes stop_codon:yes gene_type:complete
MVKLILTLLLILPISLSAQKEYTLKSRFLGQYKGEISSYNIDTGKKIMKVSSSAIYIELEKEKITITIGNNQLTGTYTVMFKAKKYFLIDARIEDQLATERIIVYKRGRKLSRDGMYPQPVTELLKY